MLVMAAAMRDEHRHLAGVVAARIAHHRPAGRMLASAAAPQRPLNAGGAPLGMVEWISPDTDTRE
jgi:hypothetical protein